MCDCQHGDGLASDALAYLKANKSDVAKFIWKNKSKAFQGVSNAQRYYTKNYTDETRPIRYLYDGEAHVKNHSFTGPGTRIELPAVRNQEPFNEIDACSKIHDIEFNRLFKLPLGSKERMEGIRKADRAALECYNKHKNAEGYRLAHGGINSKIILEELSPELFDQLMTKAYRGAEPIIEEINEETTAVEQPRPEAPVFGGTRQFGGSVWKYNPDGYVYDSLY